MSASHVIEFLIQGADVFFILSSQSVDCLEQFDLRLSLNEENFVLKSLDMGFEAVLNGLIVLHELFISCENEFDLIVF